MRGHYRHNRPSGKRAPLLRIDPGGGAEVRMVKMSETGPRLEFWYDFASTYSYLSAMRIEALATAAGVAIDWKPFLLGPIFKAQGWDNSPFKIYPAKGRYMVRDLERVASERGLRFSLPANFPQNSLLAARLALIGSDGGWIAPFTRAVYAAEFAEGADIADRATLRSIVNGLGLDFEPLLSRAEEAGNKQRLKEQTATAQALGIFGAPSFFCRGELFWGDDRLDQALGFARHN
jgi:2-hydroxychromene-2-carboxylate isomerase